MRLNTAAIEAFYNSSILPRVEEIESARLKAVRTFTRRSAGAILLNCALIAFLLSPYYANASHPFKNMQDDPQGISFAVQVAALVIIVSAIFSFIPLTRFQRQTKSTLINEIVRLFPGFSYFETYKFPPTLLIRSRLFDAFDEDKGGDLVKGTYGGVQISSANVYLTKEVRGPRGRRHDKTVFRGPVYHLDFPRRFRGEMRIRRDGGWLGNALSGLIPGLERIKLEDPTFENTFEVFGTDQIEARYILTTGFMELLLRVAERHNNKLEAAFFDQSVLIKVEGKTARLSVGNPLRTINWQAEVTRFIEEFQDVLVLVDELKLNQKIGL